MYKLYVIVMIISLYTLKPFLNGLGCDFDYYQKNIKVSYSIKCKLGLVISDFSDRRTGFRTVRKSIYGYWGGYSYNIPIFENKYVFPVNSDSRISILTKYEILSVWSVYSVRSLSNKAVYSFLDGNEGNMLVSNFAREPTHGFIE
ncbi:hypothetical protein [Vibrio cholerae]|uniref:hypothetical protein n=1 Tax=Vibrio cholerae TaxID=666 RepID=UPI002FDBE3D3|nr:hypothetical protein [Vibrio cholerae]